MSRLFNLPHARRRRRAARFRLAAAILLSGWLVGCATAPDTEPVVVAPPPPPPRVETPAEPVESPLPEPFPATEEIETDEEVERAAGPSRVDEASADLALILSGQLGLPPGGIRVVEAAESVWPNACLGFPAEGEICAEVLTPGFAVTLEADGQRYSFRTDESLKRIRLVAAPRPDIGIPLAIWRDTRSSFATATIGTDGLAVGLRGGPQLAIRDRSADRERAIAELLTRFAPFSAVTEAGEVDFRGTGEEEAGPVEQRMVAEWIRDYSRSISFDGDPGAPATVFVWERTGGIAEFCDIVGVNAGGEVTISDCRDGRERRLAHAWLNRRQLTEFYHWMDTLESFVSDQIDGDKGNALSIRIALRGQGARKADPEILAAMHRLASDLYLQGYEAAHGP